MTVKRKIELMIDRELKRVLMRTLEKYQHELEERKEIESKQLSLALIGEEMRMVQTMLEQIDQQWKEGLPKILKPEPLTDKGALSNQIRELRRQEGGSVRGFTKDYRMVEVTYRAGEGYMLKVENEIHSMTPDLQLICEQFSQLVE